MKKIFYLASIAALAFSSCAKDETTEAQISAINGGAKITAAMSADDTRTHLENVDGKYKFRWTAGDQLGVYGNGANTLNNALFVLDNDSDGQAVGVFTSQQAELKAENLYLAVYPRFQTSLFTNAVWNEQADGSWVMDDSKVKVQIPAKQKYQNATPYSGTVPAISTSFDVVEDGNVATLKMQPLVDYLFVNFRSTEAIKTIALRLKTEEPYTVEHPAEYNWVSTMWGPMWVMTKEAWTETLSKDVYFQLNGVGALKSYRAEDGVRYYLNYGVTSETPGDAHVVTIETDEAYKTIDCHNANTYAFTIPAAILGMNGNVVAEISVNGGAFAELKGAAELDYKVVNRQTVYRTTKKVVDGNETVDVAVMPYENTIFWLNNMVDTDGDNVADARDSFIHNPNGDVIIENEAELLQYINEYNKGTEGFAGKDAFLCAEGSFDFSNIEKLAALYNNDVYETYFEDYLVEGFPCFNNYQNDFVGNGAVIENITLSSLNGIFGGAAVETRSENVDANAGASISDVTFKNVTAASYVDAKKNIHKGAILAAKFNGEIKNVSVVDADGQAIISEASVAQYNGLIIDGAAGLNTIFDKLNAEKDLNMKNWADVEGVQDNVFGYIVPAAYAAQVPALSVITIAEGDADEYAKLTAEVEIDTNPAVAVMIGGVNYWTGDSISGTTKAAAKTGALAAYQAVLYAEQLAVNGDKVILMNNMDLNYENLQFVRFDAAGVPSIETYTWKMPTIDVINGNSKWIANVNMVATGTGTLNNIAPFNADAVSNLTLNGVSIDIQTTKNNGATYVPAEIAGLALNATSVENVTVNDLAINAYRADSNNQASEANYADNTYSRIGWLVAQTSNIVMKNSTVNGIDSNVKGISALVAQINIDADADGSVEIYNSTATDVDAAQTSFTDYVVFGDKYKNYGGSAVAFVNNAANKNVGVRFAGIEKPVFAFNAGANSTINVILDNKLVEQLDNKTYEE